MSNYSWIELPNNKVGLYQLVGTPTTNYSTLLYGKSLLACHENHTIFFIDNKGGIIEQDKLRKDLQYHEALLSNFYVFNPKTQVEFLEIVDDLELLYFSTSSSPVVFINNIFQFLLKNARNKMVNELLLLTLGLLKSFEVPVFVTNESRKLDGKITPYLSYLLPKYFDELFFVDYKNGEQITSDLQL